jgi:hypothetical protein
MRWRARRDERGVAMVEFALVLSILMVFLLGTAEVALVIAGGNAGGNAAREGARKGILDYHCADQYPGGPAASPLCTFSPSSPAYDAIAAASRKRVSGLNDGTLQVEVRCLDGATDVRTPIFCVEDDAATPTDDGVTIDKDLIEVTVRWRHKGATNWVPNGHHDVARMVITGLPDLGATTTTTPSATTTTTAVPVTTTTTRTTTTIVGVTTTTPPCSVTSTELLPITKVKTRNGALDEDVTVTVRTTGNCTGGIELVLPDGDVVAVPGTTPFVRTITQGDCCAWIPKVQNITIREAVSDRIIGSLPVDLN